MKFKDLASLIFWDSIVEIRCGKMTHQGYKEETFLGKWFIEYTKHPEMWNLEIFCIKPQNGRLIVYVKEE